MYIKYKLISLGLFFCLSFSAFAADESTCEQLSTFAGVVMDARLEGMPLSTSLKYAEGDELLRVIILEAYKKPDYQSDEYKKRASTEFANVWHAWCMSKL